MTSYSSYVFLLLSSVCWVFTPTLIAGVNTLLRQTIAPHCSDKCGDINIPYPFGIEDGCYYFEKSEPSPPFKINCNYSSNPPTPILGLNLEVLNISVIDGEVRTKLNMSYDCYKLNGNVLHNWKSVQTLSLSNFTLSSTKNIFVAIGCDTMAWFSGIRNGKKYKTECMTTCVKETDVYDKECTGIGCCQASIPGGVNGVKIRVISFNNHTSVLKFNPCNVAFAVEKDAFTFYKANLSRDVGYYAPKALPVVLHWTIGTNNCSAAKGNPSYLCKENTECYDLEHESGYRCNCINGYYGNPYLPLGCTDINECEGKNDCRKPGNCINTNGSYYCICPKGYDGNGTVNNPCIISKKKSWLTPVVVGTGVGGCIMISSVVVICFYRQYAHRKLEKMKEHYFQQNGGHILQEKLSRPDVQVSNMIKMFKVEELKKATGNYNESSVIGRGGFGMVYKGTLPNDQIIAIKKSLKVSSSQVEQFINEVLAMSQINNKNVVKLLGCCLETDVPLLVYEFINNGTLYEHLHDDQKASLLTWDVRLRIATDVAQVLAYLHSTISTPIIHRDMKSSNILLDENYTAKVSDFGASKLVPTDQHQMATVVQGTQGYLDPEYVQTGELSEKSDVYSFGVVLVELLTREKAISYIKPEDERFLAYYFPRKLKEDKLLEILDKKIIMVGDEAIIEQIKLFANLARQCLDVKGEDRPTMKQVARELEDINGLVGSHSWSNSSNCSVLIQDKSEIKGDNNGYDNVVENERPSSSHSVVASN